MTVLKLKSLRFLLVITFVFIASSNAFAQTDESEIKAKAQEFVKLYEMRLDSESESHKRYALLVYLAPAALKSGDSEKAAKYAQELLKLAEEFQSSQFRKGETAFAIHISNSVLGIIAYNNGEIDKAKEHLLASAKFEAAHPVLSSFGPGMQLAKLLTEKGERETVTAYFDLCAGFWKNDRGRLDAWKAAVNQGKTPNFGARLTSLNNWLYTEAANEKFKAK